ncbi:MAG: hypothetical protein Q9195_004341 [Heterodermia aff. obscurata]
MSFTQTHGEPHPPNYLASGQGLQAIASAVLSTLPASSSPPANAPQGVKRALSKPSGKYDYWKDRRALSKFSGLKQLALYEISDLECLGEIEGCLKASSLSLKSLTLALSWEFALKAFKPGRSSTPNAAEDLSDPDMTESDDETPPPATVPTVNAADTRRDRLAQEAILAKVFGLQAVANEGKNLEKQFTTPKEKPSAPQSTIPLLSMMLKILKARMTETEMKNPETKRLVLELKKTLLEASSIGAQGHLAGVLDKLSPPSGSSSNSSLQSSSFHEPSNPSISPSASIGSSQYQVNNTTLPAALAGTLDASTWNLLSNSQKQSILDSVNTMSFSFGSNPLVSSLPSQAVLPTPPPFTTNTSTQSAGLLSLPDPEPQPDYANEEAMDVDMDHPDESAVDNDADEEMGDDEDGDDSTNDKNKAEAPSILSPRKRARFGTISSPNPFSHVGESSRVHRSPQSIKGKGKGKEVETTAQVTESPPDSHKTKEEAMQDYVRATHGLQLEEFTLWLIPLKASIVARALDLRVLKRITLLEVGNQAAFWNLLQRLGSSIPEIGFKRIHTDDVSHSFLSFLSTTSPGVLELYLHKRKRQNSEPDFSENPVNTASILKDGLRKHLKSLTHLMLRNDNDDTWDLDERAVRFLSLKGRGLVELAVSMKLKAMHTLTQHIPSFTSLRVLHFISLRPSNLSTELDPVSFISDAMMYHPTRSLRYICIGERYATIETAADSSKRYKSLIEKAKKADKLKKVLANSKGSGTVFPGTPSKSGANDEEDSWDENGLAYTEVSEAQDFLLQGGFLLPDAIESSDMAFATHSKYSFIPPTLSANDKLIQRANAR